LLSRSWLVIATLLIPTACTTSADTEAHRRVSELLAVSREAIVCRRSIAANARYQAIAIHMPLTAVYRATLAQMSDTRFATDGEIRTLALWTQDIQQCRQRLINTVLTQIPASLAVFVASWNRDDGIYVLLSERKLAWGPAVMRLRIIEAELLSNLTDLMFRITTRLSREEQAELSRRIAIFNALTNLAP
jgi:hypothetical protein